MADESTDDEVEQFISTVDAETVKREELSERWRARVRADEAAKQARKQTNTDLSRMTDAEFVEYRRRTYGF
jgi:hypothetical protein